MKNFVLTAVLVLLVSFCGRPSCAQFNADTPPAFSLYLADQAGDEENTPRPYYADRPTDTTIKTQNPTAALFKSMFIPGWGQIGNKKYIKAGVIIALESSLIATLVHYADKTSDARKLFDAAVDEEEKARLFEEYRDAKDERNRFSWYTATVVFLSMFDAFVDAHLAGFPKCDEKLSIDISSEEYRDLSVNLSYKF